MPRETGETGLNRIHAVVALASIRKKMEEYVGSSIGPDRQMETAEKHIRDTAYDMLRKIDTDVSVTVTMPRLNTGGRTAHLTITTKHPERFGCRPSQSASSPEE